MDLLKQTDMIGGGANAMNQQEYIMLQSMEESNDGGQMM